MTLAIIAQTIPADAVPPWVGTLSGTALSGALLYYLITKALPKMQDRFLEAIEKERLSREMLSERTFMEHREAIKAIIERDEKRHDQLMAKISELPSMMRSQV